MTDPTKGPWRIARQAGGYFEVMAGDVLVAKVAIGDDMALTDEGREPSATEARANAALIVGASELVDLLRWALNTLAGEFDYNAGKPLSERYWTDDDQAKLDRAAALTGFDPSKAV